MPKLTVIDRKGTTHVIDGKAGERLMFVLRDDHNLPVEGTCGGCASCGTCHIYVEESWVERLPPREANEQQMLNSLGRLDARRSRLACQIELDGAMEGLTFTLAPEE